MIADSVTLVVKAPNQQIVDQNIDCQSSWTVRQLKGHLSEVYPSKPQIEEQKIIYSGQLLDDNAVLKDVLRTYESDMAHTMHLVCTPKRFNMDVNTQQQIPSTDGIRQRNVAQEGDTIRESPRQETRQNDQNHSVEMQNYLSTFMSNYGRVPPYSAAYANGYFPTVPNDPVAMANHMMMMQQAYMQYMQQYAQMWQPGNTVPPTQPVNGTNEPPPQQAQAARAGAGAGGGGGGAAREEGGDWLEWAYGASRAAILFSLVYFYSSPLRFLLVATLCAVGFLRHARFFHDLAVNQGNQGVNNEQPPRENQPQAEAQPLPNDQRPNDQPRPDNNQNQQEPVIQEEANNRNQEQTSTNVQQNIPNDQQSILAVTWMIFTSFFTSLIPDVN